MKKIVIILFVFLFFKKSYSQDAVITNLQLKGGTIKVISTLIADSRDTVITNTFNKWRADYIDGSPPVDNANVTITVTKASAIVYMYSLLLHLPLGYGPVEDVLGDFKTSITSKRAGNATLDSLCTALETEMTNNYNNLKSTGNKLLLSQ